MRGPHVGTAPRDMFCHLAGQLGLWLSWCCNLSALFWAQHYHMRQRDETMVFLIILLSAEYIVEDRMA